MSDRRSRSVLAKLGIALACFGVLAVGAHMVVKPEKYSFARLSATGPQQGMFQRGVAWMDSTIGTRPAGGLLAGCGLLGIITAARPRK